MCAEFLKDDVSVEALVECLVRICRHYRFDGYLINIENNLPPYEAFRMVTFLQLLKACLGEDCLVIWYDSVILPTGQLKWQNKLNNFNK
jgi:mannosyl-glycoprotein endo-beta-N-acetylglucosaminidase